jgi:hypothetical protein
LTAVVVWRPRIPASIAGEISAASCMSAAWRAWPRQDLLNGHARQLGVVLLDSGPFGGEERTERFAGMVPFRVGAGDLYGVPYRPLDG